MNKLENKKCEIRFSVSQNKYDKDENGDFLTLFFFIIKMKDNPVPQSDGMLLLTVCVAIIPSSWEINYITVFAFIKCLFGGIFDCFYTFSEVSPPKCVSIQSFPSHLLCYVTAPTSQKDLSTQAHISFISRPPSILFGFRVSFTFFLV